MNEKYDIFRDLFFKLEEGVRRRHEHKLFKKRFRLDIKWHIKNFFQ